MSKQTSVEWLIQQLKDVGMDKTLNLMPNTIEVARLMHQQENEDAYCKGAWDMAHNDEIFPREKAEQYYQETFGGNNE